MPGVGRQLRALREQRGQTLQDVGDALRINPLYLDAIENELPDVLPPGPYHQLYQSAYCEYFGVSPHSAGLGGSSVQLRTVGKPAPTAEELRRQRSIVRVTVLVLSLVVVTLIVRMGCHPAT
ncbi:MAG: helix-turn-helix domain-containing protein [bacterium]